MATAVFHTLLRHTDVNIRKDYDNIERLEILPYHTLGKHKYEAMNKKYMLSDVPQNTEEQLEHAYQILKPYFKYVQVN